MYQVIKKMQPVYKKYSQELIEEGIIDENTVQKKIDNFMEFFKNEHEKGKNGDFDMYETDFYKDMPFIRK